MRIGIITFHNVVNYGGVLQCYALQQKLKEWGYDADVINYENKEFKRFYSPFYITKPYLRKFLYMIYAFNEKTIRRYRFNKFVNEYIKVSEKKYNMKTISQANLKYDVFITGSDQVWNLDLTHMDKNYFLEFAMGKKVSYAASIGLNSLSEEMENCFKSLLNDFDAISVREHSAQNLIKSIIEQDVDVHIDPVLLLNQNSWSKIADDAMETGEKYIVVYKINKSKVYNAAECLAREKGLKVKVIQPDKTCKRSFQKYKMASPRDFVTLFKNAEYVITDSFHGTVFSIIFHKKFAYFMDESAENRNSRILNLLGKLGLEERKLQQIHEIKKIDADIDYENVDCILNQERKRSKEYMVNAIQ